MDIITLILLALGLSFDSFAVSITSGVARSHIRFFPATRIAFFLAFFQAGMPLLGWLIGNQIKDYVKQADHWIAFGLLVVLGARMIYESLGSDGTKKGFNPLHLGTLVMMSLATSIDAFVVGISFGFLKINIWLSVVIIGCVTFIISMLGILFGKNTGDRLGKWAEVAGGLILAGIGTKILIEHLSNP